MPTPQHPSNPPSYTFTTVSCPSTFPLANRPIYPRPIANVSHKSLDTALPLIASAIDTILGGTDGKVLIHTVSYRVTDYLARNLHPPGKLFHYLRRADRQAAITGYLHSNAPSVLLAPSLDRGIDLPYDNCRSIIVCKVPYPSLGDKQVAQRLYGTGWNGQLWYTVETIRTLVQMTGRGMRAEDDQCTSYILDSQFTDLYRKYKHLMPGWWREAIRWSGR